MPSPDGELANGAVSEIHAPQVTAIDVVLVGRNDQEGSVGRQRYALDLKLARSQRLHRSAASRYRIQMNPSVFFRRKQQPIPGDPLPEIFAAQTRKRIVIAVS